MQRSVRVVLGVLGITTFLSSGCTPAPAPIGDDPVLSDQRTLTRHQYARVLMGSRCIITLEAPSEPEAARAAAMAFDEIARIEAVLSDYNPRSEAMRVMQAAPATNHPVSGDLMEVLLLARDIHNASDGAFDPTLGAITHLWRTRDAHGGIPSGEHLRDARERVGFDQLHLQPTAGTLRFDQTGMILDFGGIGKGYGARKGLKLLRELGYPVAFIDLGGDLQIGDPPSDRPEGWRIEIVTGISESRVVHLHNSGVATSGDLERFYEHGGVRYSHIIDPRTGRGITRRRAVTVIAPDAAVADALASAVSVMGEAGIDQLTEAYPAAEVTLVSRGLWED